MISTSDKAPSVLPSGQIVRGSKQSSNDFLQAKHQNYHVIREFYNLHVRPKSPHFWQTVTRIKPVFPPNSKSSQKTKEETSLEVLNSDILALFCLTSPPPLVDIHYKSFSPVGNSNKQEIDGKQQP